MKNIVCFSSGGPGNFATVVDFCKAHTDKARVVQLITDRPGIPSIELAHREAIPCEVFSFADTRGFRVTDEQRARRARDSDAVLEFLERVERSVGRIDLIVLAFRRVLVGNLVAAYRRRIINVHPADLSVHDIRTRLRRYVGTGGLERSIRDGNSHTRTSVHYVDEGIDTGELVCMGPSVRVEPGRGATEHEDLQKALSDRPALTKALEMLVLSARTPSLPIVL